MVVAEARSLVGARSETESELGMPEAIDLPSCVVCYSAFSPVRTVHPSVNIRDAQLTPTTPPTPPCAAREMLRSSDDDRCYLTAVTAVAVDTARMVCGRVYVTVRCPSVRPSVCPSEPAWADSSKPVAAGLLLWARLAGNVARLLQRRCANAGGATLSAYVGSWTRSCFVGCC